MKRLLGGATLALVAAAALLTFSPTPAQADEHQCYWAAQDFWYPVGATVDEFWGVETQPDGSQADRYRIFRCEAGGWWNYQGDRYIPHGGGGGGGGDPWGGGGGGGWDDPWGGGGGGGGGGWGCSSDPWDWDRDPWLCELMY